MCNNKQNTPIKVKSLMLHGSMHFIIIIIIIIEVKKIKNKIVNIPLRSLEMFAFITKMIKSHQRYIYFANEFSKYFTMLFDSLFIDLRIQMKQDVLRRLKATL